MVGSPGVYPQDCTGRKVNQLLWESDVDSRKVAFNEDENRVDLPDSGTNPTLNPATEGAGCRESDNEEVLPATGWSIPIPW